MSKLGAFGARLYRGEVSFDFVGRKKLWYTLSGVILILAAIGLFGRGLNLGIEFKGGAEFQVVSQTDSVEAAKAVAVAAGVENPIVTQLGNGTVRVQTPDLSEEVRNTIVANLASELGVAESEVRVQIVGPSWGSDITGKAINALIVFLVLVSLFLAVAFEWRMAVAALIALLHDVVITVGIYALTGFEVTPSTVIGVLTILGFSLYDTVVVFDKVKENTKNITRQNRLSYSGAANLALNQTLVRSINTSIVALLPVTAILVIGAGVLGAGTLRDLSLALFVGMLAGTYSSITIATPVLAQLKEREPEMKALAKRATNKAASVVASSFDASPEAESTVFETGPRNQPRRKSRSKR
jgi:preprotein translocase subunit SecF